MGFLSQNKGQMMRIAMTTLVWRALSGYVEMTQVQAAYIGSGNAGTGTLRYGGHTYSFSVGGLGVGGIGVSKIEAKGEVYGLERLRDFPGAYVQGRYGLPSAPGARVTCG
jgi:hypothetical protein